ncbi:MAG TPA: hypothetical protein VK327_10570 [Candidatus Paceibacterota bacterium]|nr:hypothetical protein [Candidatus Paceibacterota bacterium]
MEENHWEPVKAPGLIGFAVGFIGFLALLFASERGFIFLVDHANLLFHEAGHPIVGLFSTRLEPYGGTVGQLVFPVALAVSFWRKGQALSFAGSVIWFFENWLNIARYMADARALELPLVGGGDHDWNTILTRWNLLSYDTAIAGVVQVVGWLGMFSAVGFVVWRAFRDKDRAASQDEWTA